MTGNTADRPRVVASIEARMGSSRLPGKVLADIHGRPALSRLLDRLRFCRTVDDIVLATSSDSRDDALERWAEQEQVLCHRGSEDDVLQRVVDAQTYAKSDVVVERLEPINGFVRVPEAPGLGLTLDREELERLESLEIAKPSKWIVKSRFANGSRMYNIADPDNSMFMVRPDCRPLIPMSYVSPIETEYWDDDGSKEYKTMFERIERDGMVLERE